MLLLFRYSDRNLLSKVDFIYDSPCFAAPTASYDPSCHYSDVIMTTAASQIASLTVIHSIVYSDVDQRKHQRSASLAYVRGIHR